MIRKFLALVVAAVWLVLPPIATSQQLSPFELGRAHSQCHALRLLLPSTGMDYVAFLERHKQGHFGALAPIYGSYKATVDADYELGYALAAEGRVAQNTLFERYCTEIEGLRRSKGDADPFMQCVNRLRLIVFEPSQTTPGFQGFAQQVYEDRGCLTLPVPD